VGAKFDMMILAVAVPAMEMGGVKVDRIGVEADFVRATGAFVRAAGALGGLNDGPVGVAFIR
jgi:hypothetical protein